MGDIRQDLTAASSAAVAEITNLAGVVDAKTAQLAALQAQYTALGATAAAAAAEVERLTGELETAAARIAELEDQLGIGGDLAPILGTHRRHDSGNITGDGVDAHLEAERVAGRLLSFRTYAQWEHGGGGVKGTNRLGTLLEDPARPAYWSLHAGSRQWSAIARGDYDAELVWWRDWLADRMGDRAWTFTLDHEPDNNNQGPPEDHALATIHVVDKLALRNYDNCRVVAATLMDGGWQGAPIGKNTKRPDPRRWFAGYPAGFVDALGGDHYSRFPDSGNAVEPLAALAANGVKIAGDMGVGYWIGECGCHGKPGDAAANAAKARWFADGLTFMRATTDAGVPIIGLQHSDVDSISPVTDRPLNYRVDSDPAVLAAWQALVADPFWLAA